MLSIPSTFIVLEIVVIFTFGIFVSSAKQDTFFPNNSIVCFVGDSITQKGDFHNNILQYYISRHAHEIIKFCNCGISGETVEDGLSRLLEDVMIHRPTHAVIMFGINDMRKDYNKSMSTREIDIKTDLSNYAKHLEKMIIFLRSQSVAIILETPSIYDQTAVTSNPNMIGRNDILGRVAETVEMLGKKYTLKVVDYYSVMNRLNALVQKVLPSDSIIEPDRIHPSPVGHLIMTYTFLLTIEQPSQLGRIILHSDLEKSATASSNCVVSSVEYRHRNTEVEAIVRANALPFVIVEDQRPALRLVAFNRDFNTLRLRVYNLSASVSNYSLTIDQFHIGHFTSTSFESGIDLAHAKRSPQYVQAGKVKRVLTQMWKLEENERWVKFVERCCMKQYFVQENKNVVDVVSASAYLEKLYETEHPGNSYMKHSFDTYIKYQPLIGELEAQIGTLISLARELAVPRDAKIIIRPIH